MHQTTSPSRLGRPAAARAIGLGVAAVLAAAPAAASSDADYPTRPVTMLVPMAAGGPADTVVRAVQAEMGRQLGQPLVIDNRAGAAGAIAIGAMRRAPADGYTLSVANATTQTIAVNIYEKIPYDPLKDFAPIGRMVVAPGVLIASHQAAPGCSFPAFVEKLRAAPGKMQYGSAGTGSLAHLTGLRFMYETKTTMLHVPYKGLAPAMNDLYSGQVDAIFDNVSSSLNHIRSGKVCALAVQAPARLATLPEVPTYQELGFPTLNRPTWYGLVADARTPRPVVEKLNKALNAALAAPEVRATLDRLGVTPSPDTPDQFSALIREEIGMWKETVDRMRFEKIRQ